MRVGVFEFYKVKNNKLVCTMTTGWDCGEFFLYKGKGKKKIISECKEESYFKNLIYFEYTEL